MDDDRVRDIAEEIGGLLVDHDLDGHEAMRVLVAAMAYLIDSAPVSLRLEMLENSARGVREFVLGPDKNH